MNPLDAFTPAPDESPPGEPIAGGLQRLELRPLDRALGRFLTGVSHGPAVADSLGLAAALASCLLGHGHTRLELEHALCIDGPAPGLAWPPGVRDALPGSLAQAREQWQGLETLIEWTPGNDDGATPLVVQGSGLMLRRVWRQEWRVARRLRALASEEASLVSDESARLKVQTLLPLLFPPPGPAPVIDLQRQACERALAHGLSLICGGPGTGKTYTAARLIALLHAAWEASSAWDPRRGPLRVATAAPTGKAAARLRESLSRAWESMKGLEGAPLSWREDLERWWMSLPPSTTLHALLGAKAEGAAWGFHAGRPLGVDVVVVDEASMLDIELMSALLEALPPGARLILLGDPDQLASVEAGSVLADLCTSALNTHLTRLEQGHRFFGPIAMMADAVKRGDAPALLAAVQAPVAVLQAQARPLDIVRQAVSDEGYRPALMHAREALQARDAAGFEAHALEALRALEAYRVLVALREGPWGASGLNQAIAQALVQEGLIQPSQGHALGEPLMVTRNDRSLGLFNGDIGLVLQAPGGERQGLSAADREPHLFLRDAQGGLRSVPLHRLAHASPAYAMTVHKSQGSEFGHVALVVPPHDSPVLTRELIYTGMTRARERLSLWVGEEAALEAACRRQTQRSGGLAGFLVSDADRDEASGTVR